MATFKENTQRKRRLLLVYDLRHTTYDEWRSTIRPFIHLHQQNKTLYDACLHATIIVVNRPSISLLLNTFFAMAPNTRPIETCDSESRMVELVEEIWQRYNDASLS